MAYRILHACLAIKIPLNPVQVSCNATAIDFLTTLTPLVKNARNSSFFTRKSGEFLWKGVTSVSNPGKRRGRAKGIAKIKNLNRGQVIGFGKAGLQMPGLNTPVFRGKELMELRKLPVPLTPMEPKQKFKDAPRRKRVKLHPLLRGWTGAKLPGRKIGPPDPIDGDTFEGFESWIISSQTVTQMTGNLGRTKSNTAIVITGNGNGLVGFSKRKGKEMKQAIHLAKNRAGNRLMYIERCNNHTVFHDFYSQFGRTKIYVKQMYPGYGLRCHRAIKVCCEAIGIKDLYAKVEGSTNISSLMKALFIGLLQQKTHQQLADEKKLHLVQFNDENENYPMVVASPAVVRKNIEIESNEILDFNQYVLGGKVPLERKEAVPFFTKLPSWQVNLRRKERIRGQAEVRIRLRAQFGYVTSFLSKQYPEVKSKRRHAKDGGK